MAKKVKRKSSRKKTASKTRKTVRKKAVKTTARKKRKAPAKFMAPLKVSAHLAAVVGKGPMPRTEVVKKIWVYIKKHKLQDAKNRRNINPDAKLAQIFGGKRSVSMFEMTKLISRHLG